MFNVDWIETGEGEMFNPLYENNLLSGNETPQVESSFESQAKTISKLNHELSVTKDKLLDRWKN